MALDFPSNPTNGQTYGNYAYDSTLGAWRATAVNAAATFVSATAPVSTTAGDLWWNSNDGSFYVNYYDGGGYQWVEGRAPVTAAGYMSPNYLINGAFDIWQRGTSVSTGGGGTTNYMADRWRFGNNNAASQYTASRVTNASDAPTTFALRITSARVDVNLNGLEQVMEYQDVTRLRGKQLTLSFWVRASGSQSFTSSVQTGTLTTDVYPGTGNAMTGQATIGSLTINASTSWQRVSLTTTAVSASAGQLRVSLMESVSIANGSWVEFAGVQLEEGSAATAFRRNANSLQGELAACQRYYETFSARRLNNEGYAAGTGYGYYMNIGWAVTKRVAPVVTLPTTTSKNTSTEASSSFVDGYSYQFSSNAAGNFYMLWNAGLIGTADAEL